MSFSFTRRVFSRFSISGPPREDGDGEDGVGARPGETAEELFLRAVAHNALPTRALGRPSSPSPRTLPAKRTVTFAQTAPAAGSGEAGDLDWAAASLPPAARGQPSPRAAASSTTKSRRGGSASYDRRPFRVEDRAQPLSPTQSGRPDGSRPVRQSSRRRPPRYDCGALPKARFSPNLSLSLTILSSSSTMNHRNRTQGR